MNKCWCGSTSLEHFNRDYYKCAKCNCLVSKMEFDDSIVNISNEETNLYGENYWKEHLKKDYNLPTIDERAFSDLSERCVYWLSFLLKYRLPPAKVLEIGCGSGSFVYMMEKSGYYSTGTELSKNICDINSKTFGINMLCGAIENLEIAESTYDIVVLMDVFEHLFDPLESIKEITQILKDDGILVIQTPNYTGQSIDKIKKEYKAFLQQLKPNEHIHLFNKTSVSRILEDHGFNDIIFEDPLFSYDLFLFASKKKLVENSKNEIVQYLANSPKTRFVLALLDLYNEKQFYIDRANTIEKDSLHRLEDIKKLNDILLKKDTEVKQLNDYARKKEVVITQLNDYINVKDQEINKFNEQVLDLNQLVCNLNEKINGLSTKLNLKDEEILWKRKRLSINSSSENNKYRNSSGKGKIAIDLTPYNLDGSVGGVGNLILVLLKRFQEDSKYSYLLLTSKANHEFFVEYTNNTMQCECVQTKTKSYKNLFNENKVALLFCPFSAVTYSVPHVRTVSVINDIQHMYYPEFFDHIELNHRNEFYKDVIREADHIICISEHTRKTVNEKLHYPMDNMSVAYVSIQNRFKNLDDEYIKDILEKYNLDKIRYMYFPANFWNHKNHKILLIAYNMYLKQTKDNIHLVFTGNPVKNSEKIYEAIEKFGISDRVHVLGYIEEMEIGAMYAGCEFLIYPSLFEGFGIPILEAMLAKKPILCSNVTCLPEVAGECGIYFDPKKPESIVEAINRARDEDIIKEKLAKYEEHLKVFNEDKMLQDYYQAFEQCMESFVAKKSGKYADGWVGTGLQINIPCEDHARYIELEVHLPEFIPYDATNITVAVNDRNKTYLLTRGATKTIKIKLNKKKDNSVQVVADRIFKPYKHGMGNDMRLLTFILIKGIIKYSDRVEEV